jgi:hypothetical protein
MAYALDPDTLRGIFRTHRGPSFEQVLCFPTFVRLIGDALLQHQGSGRQSFGRAQEQGTLPTGVEAVYGKLRRIPLALSLGFLEGACARIRELLPPTTAAWQAPRACAS